MKLFLSLLRLQINSQFGLSAFRHSLKRDKKTLWKALGLCLVILVAVGQLGVLYVLLVNAMYDASLALRTPELILTLGSVSAGVVTLFLGIVYILSALFFASDTELLFTLPLPQSHIFSAKFALVLLSEYPFTFFIMLPPVLVYGIRSGAGALYYPAAVICMLLLPVLPLLAASLLSLVLMRGISRIRHRNFLLTALGIVLVAGLVVGQNLLIARIPEEGYEEFLIGILNGSRSLIDVMGRAFFPAILITRALSLALPGALYHMLALVGFTALALSLVWLFSSFIFQQGALAQLETAKSSRPARMRFSGSSPVMTFFKLEWKNLLRTPVYAMNSLLQVVLFPLLLLLPMMSGFSAEDPDLVSFYNMINQAGGGNLILLTAGIMAFCCFLNTGAATSFSREGRQFWILKSIPVPAFTQVAGKLLCGYSITLLTILLSSVAMAVSFRFPPLFLLAGAVLAAAVSVAPTALSLLIDLMRPKLVWNNPQEAIKQNLNAALSMLLSLLYMAVFAGLAGLLLILGAGAVLTYAVLLAAALAASAASVAVLLRLAQGFYIRIEG